MFFSSRVKIKYFLVLWLSILSTLFIPARGATYSENQIKAVYLFNFAEFIRWPETAFSMHPDTFHFCALSENNPVIRNLQKVIAGEKVKGRNLVFRHIENPQLVKGCQILYIQNHEFSAFNKFSSDIEKQNILSVSDTDDFVKRGGMIVLSKYNNRLRPTINIQRLKQAGLNASVKLLKLALIVKGG